MITHLQNVCVDCRLLLQALSLPCWPDYAFTPRAFFGLAPKCQHQQESVQKVLNLTFSFVSGHFHSYLFPSLCFVFQEVYRPLKIYRMSHPLINQVVLCLISWTKVYSGEGGIFCFLKIIILTLYSDVLLTCMSVNNFQDCKHDCKHECISVAFDL